MLQRERNLSWQMFFGHHDQETGAVLALRGRPALPLRAETEGIFTLDIIVRSDKINRGSLRKLNPVLRREISR